MRFCLVAMVAAFTAAGTSAAPPDWPHLRGPNYDAHSDEINLVDSWPEGGPPALWSREMRQGYSGFVIAEGRAFTQCQDGTGMEVVALDAATGADLWRRRVDWSWQPLGQYPGPYATPTYYRSRIYYTTPAGRTGCLDAADGRPVWEANLKERYDGKGTEFGYAASPTVEAGRVYLPVGGHNAGVVALDMGDGSTLWTAGSDPASYCPVYPITFEGRRLLVAFLRNSVLLLEASSGAILYRKPVSSHYDEHSAWPLYREPDLMFAAPFKAGSDLLRLKASPALHADPVWASRELSNDVCSSVLAGDTVYGFDLQQAQSSTHRASRGQFKCLDFATGRLRWTTDRVGQATVLVADGKLILLDDTGTLILARVNPERYEELARCRVLGDGLCWTPPALCGGRLYLRNQSRAVCLDIGRGAPVPGRNADRRVVQAISGRAFDWSQLLGREPEYPHDAPRPREVGLWFAWCLFGVFGPAAVAAGLCRIVAPLSAKWIFFSTAFTLGLAGTTSFSRWADTFVLTWPASLYLSFRVLVGLVGWANTLPTDSKKHWIARGAVLCFIALCFGYFKLCAAVDYAVAGSFLFGFLTAVPFAIAASRTRNRWLRFALDLSAFAVYFWTSGLYPGWVGRG